MLASMVFAFSKYMTNIIMPERSKASHLAEAERILKYDLCYATSNLIIVTPFTAIISVDVSIYIVSKAIILGHYCLVLHNLAT